MADWHVGQKIVFIGRQPKLPLEWTPPELKGSLSLFKKGGVYTIREIDPDYIRSFGMVGIRVEEVVYPQIIFNFRPFEIATLSHHFRPIIERKTDISVFIEMLTPKQVKEKA